MEKTIAVYTNEEEGFNVQVTTHRDGYCVSIQDECGEYLESNIICPTQNMAIERAVEIAYGVDMKQEADEAFTF